MHVITFILEKKQMKKRYNLFFDVQKFINKTVLFCGGTMTVMIISVCIAIQNTVIFIFTATI